MDSAESWALHIVQAYTNAEVHSIKGSPGDIADVGVFSDNADKMIFKFLESFELGYIFFYTFIFSKSLKDDNFPLYS